MLAASELTSYKANTVVLTVPVPVLSTLICSQTNWQCLGQKSVDYWPSLSSLQWQTPCDSCKFLTIKATLCFAFHLKQYCCIKSWLQNIHIFMLLLKNKLFINSIKIMFFFMEISRIITLMWHKGSNACWRIKEGPILTGGFQTRVTTHTGLNIFCLMCKTWCNDRLILYKDMQKPKTETSTNSGWRYVDSRTHSRCTNTHNHRRIYSHTNPVKKTHEYMKNTCTNTQTLVGLLLGEKCCWHKQNQHTKYREE